MSGEVRNGVRRQVYGEWPVCGQRKWQLEGSGCGGHNRRSSCHWRALTLFTLRAADPRRTHRLFGNRHHPQTARIIHLSEKLSTIFCDAFDKKRTLRGPFDSAFYYAYTLPSVRSDSVSGQVAQLVEHATENRGVGGSTPSLAIKRLDKKGRPTGRSFLLTYPARGHIFSALTSPRSHSAPKTCQRDA